MAAKPDAVRKMSALAHTRAWAARKPEAMANDIDLYSAFAERALKLGNHLLAHDICHEGLRLDDKLTRLRGRHARLRQLYGLALARCGATSLAQKVLLDLHREGVRDEETCGMARPATSSKGPMRKSPVDVLSIHHLS